jgi:hypothetical protein
VSKRRQQQAALQGRETSYSAPYLASNERRRAEGYEPKTFPALLKWYEHAWWAEIPAELHGPGVWRDYGEEGVGGSHLGAPQYADAFRRWIENSPRETDDDGYYVRPLQASLAKLAEGNGKYNPKPETRRLLVKLAQCNFDPAQVGDEIVMGAIESGLRTLWTIYKTMPGRKPNGKGGKSESQLDAEKAA